MDLCLFTSMHLIVSVLGNSFVEPINFKNNLKLIVIFHFLLRYETILCTYNDIMIRV